MLDDVLITGANGLTRAIRCGGVVERERPLLVRGAVDARGAVAETHSFNGKIGPNGVDTAHIIAIGQTKPLVEAVIRG